MTELRNSSLIDLSNLPKGWDEEGTAEPISRGALEIAQGLLDALEEEDSAITPGIFPDTEYEYEEGRGPGVRLEWVSKTTHHVIVIIADGNFDLYSLDAEADEFFSLETDSFSVAMDFAKTAQGRNNDK
jgi:hypothetical protein